MLLFYLVAYLFSNMGAFMVVEAVARAEGSSALRTFRGLAQRSPVLALAMLLFLLSLGGIPFVVGFWAKLYVLWAAAQAGLYGLVLLAAVLTVVALFYYLLVAKQMYIDAPARPTPVPVALGARPGAARQRLGGGPAGALSRAARRRGDAGGRPALLTAARRALTSSSDPPRRPSPGASAGSAPGSTRPAPRPSARRPTPSGRPARPSGPRSTRTGARVTAAASPPGRAAAGSEPARKPGTSGPRQRPVRARSAARHVAHRGHPRLLLVCSDGPRPGLIQPRLS